MAYYPPVDPPPVKDTRIPYECSKCHHTQLLWSHEVAANCYWLCGQCDNQNALPIPEPEMNKYRVIFKDETDTPSMTIEAENVTRMDGYFEFWIDNQIFVAFNQDDIQSCGDLAHKDRMKYDVP